MVMIPTNKVPAVVATAVLFLVVAIAPQWTKAQTMPPMPQMPPMPPMSPMPPMPPMPEVDPVCKTSILDIAKNCYATLSSVPSEECCKGLQSASKTQVTCLCDNFIAHPVFGNLTRTFYDQINTACDVLDKYGCDETCEAEDANKGNANGGATNKIAASMGLFGLVASLFFLLF